MGGDQIKHSGNSWRQRGRHCRGKFRYQTLFVVSYWIRIRTDRREVSRQAEKKKFWYTADRSRPKEEREREKKTDSKQADTKASGMEE